jgi:hypothetical protein
MGPLASSDWSDSEEFCELQKAQSFDVAQLEDLAAGIGERGKCHPG